MTYSRRLPLVLIFALACGCTAYGQRNNPFSANPESGSTVAAVQHTKPGQAGTKTPSVGANETAASLTEIYKIGAGDTLSIVLENAPNASGYYSVSANGTIDFPLAGNAPKVGGMTAAEASQMLSSRITLYQNARLQITVREFGSHKINVSGLVERNGERFLQREAVPLFTIKADVGLNATATKVMVKRSTGAAETYVLSDLKTDDVLICSGDSIDFMR
ncbi:MAG: polysaccharide biosynthesis/export family protein [Pyrinomonadaceae bacterium]